MPASTPSTRITAIQGNAQWLDGGAMFGNAPRSLWSTWLPPDEQGRIRLACRCLLIEHGGLRILCETGIGAFFAPKLAERYGVREPEHLLLKNLALHGVQPDDIDLVILSHLHFDHAGGLLPTYAEAQAGHDELLFTKARYVVGKVAMERALHPHLRDHASFIPGMCDKLLASGRLLLVASPTDARLGCDRISFFYTDGHTPGQMHTVFRGDAETVVFCGDLIPGTPWLHLPITMGYDRSGELLIDEKQAFYANAIGNDWLLFYTHDSSVAASRVRKDPKGRFIPWDVRQELTNFPI